MTADALFVCSEVGFSYKLGSQRVTALAEVSFNISHGHLVCLTGPSGSGKSTLLNLLGLIEPIQHGSIVFKGQELSRLREKDKNRLRRYNLGFIFQNFHLIEVLTAYENVEYFVIRQNVPRQQRRDLVERALTNVGLWEHRHKRPTEMSGGQRQRVAIARALAKNPDVIIADEPTASLDQENSVAIMDLLANLVKDQAVTIVMASHDPLVLPYADRVIQLTDGKLAELPKEVRKHAV